MDFWESGWTLGKRCVGNEKDSIEKCQMCHRPGKLRGKIPCQAMPHLGINKAWIERIVLCQWHWAAESRFAKRINHD